MNCPIPFNLPPFYKSAVIHLLNELRAFSDNIEKQRKIFEIFCQKFTMITELWEHWALLEIKGSKNVQDEKFQKLLLNLKYRCMGHLNHENSMKQIFKAYYRNYLVFTMINNKYLTKLLIMPKFEEDEAQRMCRTEIHEKHNIAVKTIERKFSIPHSRANETLKTIDQYSVPKTDKDIMSTYKKNLAFYDKIMAVDKNDMEWINCLVEVDDIEFVVQNVECRIAKNPGNVVLWSLYIQYLNKQKNSRVLEVYQKFCRLFIEDIKAQKEYKKAIWRFNEAGCNVTKYYIDIINFEVDFGLVKNAITLLIDALKNIKFQPKRLYNFAKKFAKKYGNRQKIEKAIEKCKFRFRQIKYTVDLKIWKDITVTDVDPIDAASMFNKNIFQQYIDFPRSINNYILETTSFDLYNKLIKTCKFFFIRKKFVVPVWFLQCNDGNHRPQKTLYYRNNLYMNPTQISSRLTNPTTKTKFWIGRNLVYNSIQAAQQNLQVIFKIGPAIYRCDIEYLTLDNTTLTLAEYDLLTGKWLIKKIRLCGTIVKKNDKELAPLEDLMETLPNAFDIFITSYESGTIIPFTPLTTQKLLNLERNVNIYCFTIDCSSDLLDPILFIQFIKKTAAAPKSYFTVYYNYDNVQNYQDMVNEAAQLQASWSPAEETPKIKIYYVTEF